MNTIIIIIIYRSRETTTLTSMRCLLGTFGSVESGELRRVYFTDDVNSNRVDSPLHRWATTSYDRAYLPKREELPLHYRYREQILTISILLSVEAFEALWWLLPNSNRRVPNNLTTHPIFEQVSLSLPIKRRQTSGESPSEALATTSCMGSRSVNKDIVIRVSDW